MRFDRSARRSSGRREQTPARGLARLRVYTALTMMLISLGSATSAAASQLNVRDEGHLRFITSYGSELIDEGPATGTVPGKVRVHFIYNGDPQVSARFEIYGHSGSISGRANARLNNPTSPDPSFRGAFTITRGSGRYAHIHGTGELFGVFTRRGYGLVVQTIGRLNY
jgi:hypothetical protein